ncbi:MAG: hypothetical protein ACT4QF_07620 [Sporichthyaceae bacterium]
MTTAHDQSVLPLVFDLLAPASVVQLGGRSAAAEGLGAERVLAVSDVADLSGRFDLALCLDFDVDHAAAGALVAALCASSDVVLICSTSSPRGWDAFFGAHDFHLVDCLGAEGGLLYARRHRLVENAMLRRAHRERRLPTQRGRGV